MRCWVLCDGVDKEDRSRRPIESFDNGAEGLLACGIPDLHLDAAFLVEADLLGVKLDAEGGRIPLAKLVLGESVEEAALADPGRTDYDHLESFLLLLAHMGLYLMA
jgi:hypothetical protein